MDWAGIEKTEAHYDEVIARAMKDGSEAALAFASAVRLQKAVLRPWVDWVMKAREEPPERTTNAMIHFLAHTVTETVMNAEWEGEGGKPSDKLEVAVWMAQSIAKVACEMLEDVDGHDPDCPHCKGEGSIHLDLHKKSDA